MISRLAQFLPRLPAGSARPLALSAIAALTLQGCVVAAPLELMPAYVAPTVVAAPASAPAAAPAPAAPDEANLMPPLPSFTTLADCESAYGPSACGSGQAVYLSAGLVAPAGADAWFIPYAFGVMTGVLINHYFAPPSAYVRGVDYHSFTAPGAVNGYKSITRSQINSYRQAPTGVRTQLAHSGPARYSPSRGAITGQSNSSAFDAHRENRGPLESLPQASRPQQPHPVAYNSMQSRPAVMSPRPNLTPATRPAVRPSVNLKSVAPRRR